jgi:hypothetical protein
LFGGNFKLKMLWRPIRRSWVRSPRWAKYFQHLQKSNVARVQTLGGCESGPGSSFYPRPKHFLDPHRGETEFFTRNWSEQNSSDSVLKFVISLFHIHSYWAAAVGSRQRRPLGSDESSIGPQDQLYNCNFSYILILVTHEFRKQKICSAT